MKQSHRLPRLDDIFIIIALLSHIVAAPANRPLAGRLPASSQWRASPLAAYAR